MKKPILRNDDISFDTNLEKLKQIQSIFEKHGLREVYSIVPFGRSIYDSDQYTHNMPLETLEGLLGTEFIGTNLELVRFLHESISRGHQISLHGWSHTRVTDYDDKEERIARAKEYVENLFGTKVQYFVPPFNHYNQHVVTACQNLGLPISIGGGQLEEFVKRNLHAPHDMYWYHYWRLNPEELDQWLKRSRF